MLFVVDIGNSHTVVGLYEDEKLLGQWRLKSDREKTPDEIGMQFHSLFEMANLKVTNITGIIISSVVRSLEAAWLSCCEKYFLKNLRNPVFIVSDENLKNLINIEIDYPKEVGADRLVNAIAGWAQYKSNLIVIDFGTAITFDCITSNCSYIGGTILPGIAISLEALSTRTAKLPHIDVSTPPETVIGKNTVQAMKSGVLNGYGAMIDGLVEILGKELCQDGGELNVMATGGMANMVIPYSGTVEKVDQLLTLKGLHYIYNTIYAG